VTDEARCLLVLVFPVYQIAFEDASVLELRWARTAVLESSDV
jgi:hypothetical protein